MRARLLLLFLVLGGFSLAQSRNDSATEASLRQRISRLSPLQRLPWINQYNSVLNTQSRFREARTLLQYGLKTAQQARLPSWEAFFYYRLGHLAETEGHHPVALNHYLQALTIYRSIHLYDQQQRMLARISGLYAELGNQPKRQEYSQQFFQLHQRYKQPVALREKLLMESNLHGGVPDSLLTSHEKLLTFFRINREWDNFYSVLGEYGKLLIQSGRYQEAQQALQQCLAFGLKYNDPRRILYAYLYLPLPLLHIKRFNEAEAFAKLALHRVIKDPERQDEHLAEVYALLAQIAEARGHYRQALTYERQAQQAATKRLSAEKNRQITEIETRYQIVQKQARINQLNLNNQRQLNQIRWQGGGLLALLLLLGIALWQYRMIGRINNQLISTNQTITQNNRLISEQADRLAVLMRELHHRVKNNLAIVSSLLRMQSRRLNDPLAIRAVQDGQRRVEAISLIHQQFYQTENVVDVPIKGYITDLTEGLLIGYGFNLDEFDCVMQVADIQLDVDVAIPLGLILNEVLTNAFKYAYTEVSRPYLKVLLRANLNLPERGLLLEVQDNGPGLSLPDTMNQGRRASFGQRLIRELTTQLGGQVTFTSQKGTCFRLFIPNQPKPSQMVS